MKTTKSTATTSALKLAALSKVLSDPRRWGILRELGKGEALPVQELARRVGTTPNLCSKHMTVLRAAEVVVTGYGGLYSLAPKFRPAPGADCIDFGHCLLRIAPPT